MTIAESKAKNAASEAARLAGHAKSMSDRSDRATPYPGGTFIADSKGNLTDLKKIHEVAFNHAKRIRDLEEDVSVIQPVSSSTPIPSPTVNSGGFAFSGTAYVNGAPTTGLNSDGTKLWVKCTHAGAASEQTGPAPNPFPANEEWYEKANTYGDIHCWV